MLPLLSLLLACEVPEASPPDTGEPADTGAEDSAAPEDTAAPEDSAAPEDTATSCGETAPTAGLVLGFERTSTGGGAGTVDTVIWWITLDISATDPDGDLAFWVLDLWWAAGDAALNTDRPADASETVETWYEEDFVPACTTTSVQLGLADVLSEDPEASLLIPGQPYAVGLAVTDEAGHRSEIVTVSGVAPEVDEHLRSGLRSSAAPPL